MRKMPLIQPVGKRPFSFFLLALFFLLSNPLLAQELPMEDQSGEEDNTFRPAISIGLNTGTHAIYGADVTLGFLEAVNFRLSYNRIRASLSDFSLDAGTLGLDGQTLLVDSDINLSTFGILVDFPFTRSKKLRLMAGAMVELDNYVTIAGRFSDNLTINDFILTPERIGVVGGTYRTESSIYPYFGLGFGRSLAANKLTFAFEAGVYLRGKPQISVESTGILGGNEANGPILSDNLESLQWHPSIGLRLAYGFHVGKHANTTPENQDGLMTAQAPMENTEEEETPPKRQKKEKPADVVEMTTPAEPQPQATPDKPVSPYLALNGQAIDGSTGNNLPYVIVDLYKILPGGQKQKALSQRYPGGTFSVDLERGVSYEIVLSHYLYMDDVSTIEADPDPTKASTMKTFTLNQK